MTEPKVERLTEAGIINAVDNLKNAIVHGTDIEAGVAAIFLVGSTLINLNRLADASERQAAALEKLSQFEIHKIGELLFGGYDDGDRTAFGTVEQTAVGLDLAPGEIEAIKALRRGDLALKVVVHDPNTDPTRDGLPWALVDGQPNVDAYTQVEVWGNKGADVGRWPANEVDWLGGRWQYWRISAPIKPPFETISDIEDRAMQLYLNDPKPLPFGVAPTPWAALPVATRVHWRKIAGQNMKAEQDNKG